MKSISYILLAFLLIVTYGCKEDDHPYVGYITIEAAVVNAAGGTATVTAQTDIDAPIEIEVGEDVAEWCTVTANGKEITVNVTEPNLDEDIRTGSVNVRCGYRVATFTIIQQFKGQEYLYDWTGWEASGSDVQASDGGGYPSLFTEERTTFWHSQYSPVLDPPLPHWLVIDMKEELPIAVVRVGRRHYAANGNNYATVKTMEVYTSTDNQNYTKMGGFTFALPWTAPDGTVITGTTSPKIPSFEDIVLSSTVTARYVKLLITEANSANGTCQVSYFKAFSRKITD